MKLLGGGFGGLLIGVLLGVVFEVFVLYVSGFSWGVFVDEEDNGDKFMYLGKLFW